ncbi:efflux RND transporter periplasmic adaptor subunit [Actinoplanes sp. NPDC051470]|uniref:efflux RND transporter periplasmic adaptor subunit n=1 Tax=Actinoplanes sp. NPDC051470 TaxID=3157224 RepID=UPI003441196D
MLSSHQARRILYGALALAVTGGAVVIGMRLAHHQPPAGEPVGFVAVNTTEVVEQTMSTSESLPGKLGFGAARPVIGTREGVVTWLPRAGATIGRGDQMFRVDDEAVSLFLGGMPLYRTLSEPGTVGRDVRVVAENLEALGYPIGRQPKSGERVTQQSPARPTASSPAPSHSAAAPAPAPVSRSVVVGRGEGVYTRSLIAAVKSWQRAERLPVTGRIEAADVVVFPGAVRVNSLSVQLGAPASGPLLTVSTTAKVITVAAEPGQAAAIDKGDRATITMPDNDEVPGTVSSVGATAPVEGSGDEPGFTVVVTVNDPKAVAALDAGQVQVTFTAETHRDVLAVPVDALLALAEGGYAVQTEDGRLFAVKTGLYAKGYVEITGAGLTAGMRVVTAS